MFANKLKSNVNSYSKLISEHAQGSQLVSIYKLLIFSEVVVYYYNVSKFLIDRKMENTGSESRLLTSFKLPHSDSKEATLPSCINFEKKKIKLTPSSVSSCSELSSSKPGGKITLKRCVGISSTCLQETDTEKKCTIAPPEKKIIKLVSNPTSSNKQRDTSVRNTEESTLMDETTKQDFMASTFWFNWAEGSNYW